MPASGALAVNENKLQIGGVKWDLILVPRTTWSSWPQAPGHEDGEISWGSHNEMMTSLGERITSRFLKSQVRFLLNVTRVAIFFYLENNEIRRLKNAFFSELLWLPWKHQQKQTRTIPNIKFWEMSWPLVQFGWTHMIHWVGLMFIFVQKPFFVLSYRFEKKVCMPQYGMVCLWDTAEQRIPALIFK